MERAATGLIIGDDNFDTVVGEDADGGAIEFSEGDAGYASGEKRYATATLANGGISGADLAEEEVAFDLRREGVEFGDSEKIDDAEFAAERLQAGLLVETNQ